MAGPEAGGGDGSTNGSADEAPRRRKRTSATGALFQDAARALGRTAGRARNAIERLGERGAISLAVRKFQREKAERLKELGALAREALARPEGELHSGDPGVGELLHSLDRLDEKIERLTEKVGTGPEGGSEGSPEDADEEGDEQQ